MEMHASEWEPSPEPDEPRDLRPRYRICRAGFALTALGLGLLTLDALSWLLVRFGHVRNLADILRTVGWDWTVGAPITWGTFLGSVLLLGRFNDTGWRRRSILLVFLNTIDLGFWCMDHAAALGLEPLSIAPANEIRVIIGPFMNLAELILFAGLARDLCSHLSRDNPYPSFAVRIAAMLGMAAWLFYLVTVISIQGGRMPNNIGQLHMLWMLQRASNLALAIACGVTAIMAAQACYLCSEVVKELDPSHSEDDPFAL